MASRSKDKFSTTGNVFMRESKDEPELFKDLNVVTREKKVDHLRATGAAFPSVTASNPQASGRFNSQQK